MIQANGEGKMIILTLVEFAVWVGGKVVRSVPVMRTAFNSHLSRLLKNVCFFFLIFLFRKSQR